MTVTAPAPAHAGRAPAARLRPADLAGLASVGLRTRKLRAGAVGAGHRDRGGRDRGRPGPGRSSPAGLLAEIAALGTNLLTVSNGQSITGAAAELPLGRPGHDRPAARRHRVQDTGGVERQRLPLAR